MLLLGIDLGTSAVKVSVVDADTLQTRAQATWPDEEAPILSEQPGWAEQDPARWWQDVQQCILRAHATKAYDPRDIGAVGIAYQMHGLVAIDEIGEAVRQSIIWCDSRAVPYGDAAFEAIGPQRALQRLYNSPGNFTAAKLAWVKEHEPATYARVKHLLLPGDYIALRMTGEAGTTPSALSEGILWDFVSNGVSLDVLNAFGFSGDIIPQIRPVFSEHGRLHAAAAGLLGLRTGIPVSYKAGDQPNNALSLNVMQPGEVAATAGTSGVVYGVAEALQPDPLSRLNCFAHVNHASETTRIGLLLCINGCGIMNKVSKQWLAPQRDYAAIDREIESIPPGSEGLRVLPFGNGAERMLQNRHPGALFAGIDLNRHQPAHAQRATQEGIACAFRYGLDIMRGMGFAPARVRAGRANLFRSRVFTEAFVELTQTPVELYDTDGATGAALGAGIGVGLLNETDLGRALHPLSLLEPAGQAVYEGLYQGWRQLLERQLSAY